MVFRVLLFFAALALVSAVAAFFAETPGGVTIAWRNYRLDTSVGVLLVAVALVAAVTAVVYRFWRALATTPRKVTASRAERRREQGFLALTRGMVAIAAGDTAEAKRQAKRANHMLDRPPGALLLEAQAAQLEGRPEAAREVFDDMLERKETELLAVRGLLSLAESEGDTEKALALAERANKLSPTTPWALTRLLELQTETGAWTEAEKTVKSAARRKVLSAAEARHKNAVIHVQRSLSAERGGDRSTALGLAKDANRLEPDFLPASLNLAALLHADGKPRQARKVIERAWAERPHPDLARLFDAVTGIADPLPRLAAFERLEALKPDDPAARLTLARVALDAKLWGEARRRLDGLDGAASGAEYYRLRAELEEKEKGDGHGAREWLARASEAPPAPGWVCDQCGAVAREWSAKCGNCGAFDGLDWRQPPRVTALAPGAETVTIIDSTGRAAAGKSDDEVGTELVGPVAVPPMPAKTEP